MRSSRRAREDTERQREPSIDTSVNWAAGSVKNVMDLLSRFDGKDYHSR